MQFSQAAADEMNSRNGEDCTLNIGQKKRVERPDKYVYNNDTFFERLVRQSSFG